ncbi:hypothetical protein HPB52_025258 [Rhipicephalus sanguineus]|uniref:Uncharacterized protein n=1 Tax=Rhipicephalus sanguineus TaxID=34632 RepID=A0A9D4YRK4_RHISA|nr:hypothetical protein HPB52_025258 [Rhipicephalus sanguineus]
MLPRVPTPDVRHEGARSPRRDKIAVCRSDERAPSKSAEVSPLSTSDPRPSTSFDVNDDSPCANASTNCSKPPAERRDEIADCRSDQRSPSPAKPSEVRPTSDPRTSMSFDDSSCATASTSYATSSTEHRTIQARLETRYVPAGTVEAQASRISESLRAVSATRRKLSLVGQQCEDDTSGTPEDEFILMQAATTSRNAR